MRGPRQRCVSARASVAVTHRISSIPVRPPKARRPGAPSRLPRARRSYAPTRLRSAGNDLDADRFTAVYDHPDDGSLRGPDSRPNAIVPGDEFLIGDPTPTFTPRAIRTQPTESRLSSPTGRGRSFTAHSRPAPDILHDIAVEFGVDIAGVVGRGRAAGSTTPSTPASSGRLRRRRRCRSDRRRSGPRCRCRRGHCRLLPNSAPPRRRRRYRPGRRH
jgi:hypothetical protein